MLYCIKLDIYMSQMCSGITRGRVPNGVFYAQRFHKLIYLQLFTECYVKIFPQSSEQRQFLEYRYLLHN